MQVPDQLNQYSTFPCTNCGQGIPATMPEGLKFPCPYCQTPLVAPGGGWSAEQAAQYQSWAMEHGAAAASLADQQYREQHNPGAAHFASASEPVVTVLPGGELLALGCQVQEDGSWLVKALDLRTQQTRWEAEHGTKWSFPPGRDKIAVRSERVYIANEGVLTALRVHDGAKLWSAFLTAPVKRDSELFDSPDELMLFEVTAADGFMSVVFLTEQGQLMAVRGDNGQLLLNAQYDDGSMITPVPGVGVLLHAWVSVLHALPSGQVLARWEREAKPCVEEVAMCGGQMLARVSEFGDDGDEEGIAVLDPANPTNVVPRPAADVQFDPPPAVWGTKVFASINCLPAGTYEAIDLSKPPPKKGLIARFFGQKTKGDRKQLPVPGMSIESMRTVGNLVLVQLRPTEGGDGRRIIGLDPNTLAMRFDSGPLPEEPSNMVWAHVQARDEVFVHVTSPTNDDNECELRAVDTATGQVRWAQAVGEWTHHFLSQGTVVVYRTGQDVLVLDLATGAPTAQYPF